MGKKRGGKNNVFKKDAAELGVDTRKKFKGEEAISEWEYEHPVFEAYYRVPTCMLLLANPFFSSLPACLAYSYLPAAIHGDLLQRRC